METIELAQRQSKLNKKLNAQEFNDLKHKNISLQPSQSDNSVYHILCLVVSCTISNWLGSSWISLLLLLCQAVYSRLDASFKRNRMNKIGLRLSQVGIRV